MGVGLAFGVGESRVLARTDAGVVDVGALARRGVVSGDWWERGTLDGFLAAGRPAWEQVCGEIDDVVRRGDVDGVVVTPGRLELAFTVGDYVDFYASEQHATTLGALLRPGQPPLPPNWRHLPIGYHGRSGTIVVSGTPVRRPCGQRRPDPDAAPDFGPTERLDVEVEVAYVVGVPSAHGTPVGIDAFADHVFGVCLLNDWSARDLQAWEGQPLGPFLGKSFATSVSAWVTPLCVLEGARCAVGSADASLLPYLREPTAEPRGLDLALELAVNDEVLSRPSYRSMYWSPAQMLAHMTVNGASVRTGDVFASGTVSGPDAADGGSLIELSANTSFLADGDEAVIRGVASTGVELGEVRGTVLPALTTSP